MGGSQMVSRNERKQSVRQNGSDRDNPGKGTAARRGFDQWRASRHTPRSAAGHVVRNGDEHSAGSVGLLVGPGDTPSFGRAHSAPGAQALGDTVTKNLFIAGTPGVGKTSLLRDVTLPKRSRIG